MVNQGDVDAGQDAELDTQQDLLRKLIAIAQQEGYGDITPTEWQELEEPVPFSDRAIYPPYVVGGHLVKFQNNAWVDACHDFPPHPFNPFWGVAGHQNELVGLEEKYVPATHDQWIGDFGEVTKADRLARIAELLG